MVQKYNTHQVISLQLMKVSRTRYFMYTFYFRVLAVGYFCLDDYGCPEVVDRIW